MPDDLDQAFKRVEKKISDSHENVRSEVTALRTLVLGHYADVHKLLRAHERHIDRINEKLGLGPLAPEPAPKALPDPP